MIKIEIYHPDISAISDRSIREILKYASKSIRIASFAEINEILHECNLSRRDQQSILDRIRPRVAEGPIYYIDGVERGSIDIKSTAAAFGLFLLASTAGETVKDAWKETEIHKRIVAYVDEERDENFANKIAEACRQQRNDWGRFYVQDVEIHDHPDGKRVRIILETYGDKEPVVDEEVDEKYVRDFSSRAVERLRFSDDGPLSNE